MRRTLSAISRSSREQVAAKPAILRRPPMPRKPRASANRAHNDQTRIFLNATRVGESIEAARRTLILVSVVSQGFLLPWDDAQTEIDVEAAPRKAQNEACATTWATSYRVRETTGGRPPRAAIESGTRVGKSEKIISLFLDT